MYISLYRHLIQISTIQSEEQHVVYHLPKFHLNQTVNEMGNAVLQKWLEPEKLVAPSAQNHEGGTWQDYTTVGWFLFRKKYEKQRFS